MFARREKIAVLAEIDELRGMALSNNQLCVVLDRLAVIGKPPRQRVARVVGEFDNFQQFAFDEGRRMSMVLWQ